MSTAAIEQLFSAANDNVNLQQQLKTVSGVTETVKLGADHGYSFTEDEVKSYLTEHAMISQAGAEGELSEDDLESVAGGFLDNLNLNVKVGGFSFSNFSFGRR
jgi:predicted ribosomally synthesized peptide with nif11-like leader